MAWGFRNPFGLAFSPQGRLFVTTNGYDVRGSRPAWGTADHLWEVETGAWYGWPDYSGNRPIAQKRYRVPEGNTPDSLLVSRPGPPPAPKAAFGVHSSSNGFDFSRSERFGYVGEAFVAQFGDMSPKVGKVMEPVGFKIVRVEAATGIIRTFAANRAGNGPANTVGGGGLMRPIDAKFSRDGKALYVVDFGAMIIRDGKVTTYPGSGVLWKIARKEAP